MPFPSCFNRQPSLCPPPRPVPYLTDPRHLSADGRQSPPALQPPRLPQQRQPAWQSTNVSLAVPIGVAARDVEATTSTAAAASRHTDAGTTRGEVVGCGGVPSIDELLAPSRVVGCGGYACQYSTPSRAAPPPVATASGGGQVNPSDDALPDDGSPLPILGALDPHWGSHAASLPTTKASLGTTTSGSSPIVRYSGAGELGSVEASPIQPVGGLTPLGLGVGGTPWQEGADRSGGAGSGAEPVYSRFCHDERLLHLSPRRDPYSPHSTLPQVCREERHHRSHLRPILPPVDTSITPPWSRRGGSDPGPYVTAATPPPSRVGEASARSSSCSLPALLAGEGAIGGQRETGGRTSFSIGELHADSAGRRVGGYSCVGAGAGSGDGATTEGGQTEHGRHVPVLFDWPAVAAQCS